MMSAPEAQQMVHTAMYHQSFDQPSGVQQHRQDQWQQQQQQQYQQGFQQPAVSL